MRSSSTTSKRDRSPSTRSPSTAKNEARQRSNSLSEREDRLDHVFSALGHQTRRQLLSLLGSGPTKITELAEVFDISLPAVSKHLRVLERAGLVRRQIDGRIHLCSLELEPLDEAQAWLNERRGFWRDALAALAQFVEEPEE